MLFILIIIILIFGFFNPHQQFMFIH